MAAVLYCGEAAALTNGSAAALLGIESERPGLIEIAVPPHRRPRGAPDITVLRRIIPAADCTTRRGIPLTSPARTLLDLATHLSPRRLEAAVNAADKNELIDPPALRGYLAEREGQRGVRALRTLLDHHTFLLTDSELERRFVPIAKRAGLPKPLTRQRVNGFRVDFFWPELGLVVETDGLRYHRTPAQQARDRLRDQRHTAAGLTPLRFTHAQIRYGPRYVEATLRAVAGRLGRG